MEIRTVFFVLAHVWIVLRDNSFIRIVHTYLYIHKYIRNAKFFLSRETEMRENQKGTVGDERGSISKREFGK